MRKRSALWPMALAAVAVELALYRRWHQRWGATSDEVAAPMPGDERVPSSQFTATRALTIDAPPSTVWTWLVQVGIGRAGFYSYDRLDNPGRHSSDEVIVEWQHPQVGDVAAPMVDPLREGMYFRLKTLDEPRELLWTKADSTWSWRLTPVDDGRRTRLVTRLRQHYDWRSLGVLATVTLLEVGDFPMMRRMLLGIRDRSESAAR
ncbi:MAG: hypothetical protein WAN48_10620 [Actinomycetes bacterium]